MEQEKPPTLLDGEKAFETWKSALSGYVGEFSHNERFEEEEFKGKSWKGRFVIHFRFYGPYASVGADLSNGGCSCPCATLERVRDEAEQCAEYCGAKPRQADEPKYEQLKLW